MPKCVLVAIVILFSISYAQNKGQDSVQVKEIRPLPIVNSEATIAISNDQIQNGNKQKINSKSTSNLYPKRWVYTISRIYDNFEDLNNKGDQGWELVSAVYYAENGYLLCIYKKPIY